MGNAESILTGLCDGCQNAILTFVIIYREGCVTEIIFIHLLANKCIPEAVREILDRHAEDAVVG